MKSADLWQLRTLALEFAKTDFVADHDNTHADGDLPDYLDRLLVVAKMAEQAMEAQSCHGEGGAECKHDALLAEATPPQPWVPMCTPCLLEAKQAQMRGADVPEIHGAAVIADGMGLCEVRHVIQVEPTLIRAAPGQMPNGFGG